MRRRQLRVGARRLRAGPELVVSQRVHGAGERVPPLHVGLGCDNGLFGDHNRKESSAHRALHVETRQRFVSARPHDCRVGATHRGSAETEVKRFPREQRACGAAPDALAGCGRQHRSGHRRDDRLRQELTEDVVRRRSIRLPERIETREIPSPRNADARRRRVHLLHGRLDSWIVFDSVLQGLLEGEHLRWRALLSGCLCLRSPRHRQDTQHGNSGRTKPNHQQSLTVGQSCPNVNSCTR